MVVVNPFSVAIWTGDNAGAGQGFVARWTGINPGADNAFSIVSSHYTGAIPTSVDPFGFANGSKGYGITDFQLAAVPEPSTYALLGIALVGLGFYGRKRRAVRA